MFREVERVIEAGMELPPEDRLRVAEKLFESLPEDEIARAWLGEVEHRKAQWDAGLVKGIDGDDVIRRLRERAGP